MAWFGRASLPQSSPAAFCRIRPRLRSSRTISQSFDAIVMDKGPELASKASCRWSQKPGIKRNLVQPGKPTRKALVESVNARLRDGCLNRRWFQSLDDAGRILGAWRRPCADERPPVSLGCQAPGVFDQARPDAVVSPLRNRPAFGKRSGPAHRLKSVFGRTVRY